MIPSELALRGIILWGVPTHIITAFVFDIVLLAIGVLLAFGISKKIGGRLRWLWFALIFVGLLLVYFLFVAFCDYLISTFLLS